MEWFFTADHHFGHANIIKYCNRPFDTVEEMDEVLIQRWNEVVRGQDVVIYAGDFTLRNSYAQELIDRLKGNKIFLKGNHDKWIKQKRYIYHKKIKDHHVAVAHYPMESWQNSCHGSWHLHGHCHGTMRVIPNRLDVGVDCHNFYPVAFSQLDGLLLHGGATSECGKLMAQREGVMDWFHGWWPWQDNHEQ